ncbi:outer membrane beta-barrel family protein [Polaribacter sp. IC073]|uniref:outer membrane beta-barrel family protein n=1 Tax=Polaribacter sp. IC073 TaxID=2508540 RepID=UPI0011BEDD8B|nr:outer membrane beta-barrel family protein [Polaribacter sp. IC073]TXD48767.1 TonB-dependent receptor [Polaribacter sp. IC073]
MKKCIPLFLFFLSLPFYTQTKNEVVKNTGTITGQIIDYQTKKTLSYVNIICKNKAATIINGAITNKKGHFTVHKLPLDTIFMDVQFMGYKTIKRTIVLSKNKSNFNLTTIQLEEETHQLDAVHIQLETSTVVQKIDRKVIHVGKDLASAGTNSLQLLENIPSVQVNFQSGSINLRGNNNVRVLIDGKPSNLSPSKVLKQIPSSSVKSVELITNPSAKYTPEGMSGIINILLKKNTKIGFNGAISFGLDHSINTRPTGSLDANYRTGKVNFYANYGADIGKFETVALFNRSAKNLRQKINYTDNTTSNYLKTGVDFYINKKNTLSFYTSQSFADTDFSIDTKVTENNHLIFNAPNLSHYETKEQAYNLDYKLALDQKGQNIEFEVNYTKTRDPQKDSNKETVTPGSKRYNYTNKITNNSDTFLANLDYSKPLSGGKIEAGLEARVQHTFHNIITDQEIETYANSATVPKGNSTLNYDREIYSGYINYTKKFKKLAFQGGLRLEHFTVNGLFSNTEQAAIAPYADVFFTIYPSAYFTYYASDKNEFQIGYSRRVDRPGIDQVTPIQEWTSPLSTSIGNQTLQPQFTNSFEINYTKNIKKGTLSFGTFYRRTSDKIGRIINIDQTNEDRQLFSYANYDTADSYGVEFSSSFKLTKWWSFRPSANLYIQDSQGVINNKQESTKNTLFSARVSNSFKASKKLRFQLSSSYRGKSEGVQFKIQPYFLVNASAQLSVLDNNGAITLRGTDIFDGYKLDFSATNPFAQTGQYTLEYSAIYLGFSYDFGSGKNRARKRKYRESNETRGSGGVL